MRQLSRREAKYRIKFIQEHHYNKAEQKVFDETVRKQQTSYTSIYKSTKKGAVFSFMAIVGSYRLSSALKNIGVSARQAAESLSRLSKVGGQSDVEN